MWTAAPRTSTPSGSGARRDHSQCAPSCIGCRGAQASTSWGEGSNSLPPLSNVLRVCVCARAPLSCQSAPRLTIRAKEEAGRCHLMINTPMPAAHAAATATPFPPSATGTPSLPPQPTAPSRAVPDDV
jgi:hypothetical protein